MEIRVYGKGGGFAGLNWGCSGKIFGASASYLGFTAPNVFLSFLFLLFSFFFFYRRWKCFCPLDFSTRFVRSFSFFFFLVVVIVEISFSIDCYAR